VLGWADTRSSEQTAVLRKRFDEAEIHSRTGARFHSSFWPAKLLWLKKTDPKAFARTDKWLSLSDYIVLKLCGEPITSLAMASATGIFDIRKCTWDASLLKYIGIKNANLPVIADDASTFQLNARFTKLWSRLASARWFPAIGDGAANNIGAGCVSSNKAALMIGTSGAMRVAYKGDPPATIPFGLWCYRIDRERVIIGGALSDGGGLYQWLRDNLILPKNAEAAIAKRPPAGHGLIFLPFLAGERSTGYYEDAHGSVIGLRSSTDTVDILQAALESVAFRFAEIFDQLNSVVNIRDVIASGGALRESPVWTQIIADVLGRNLTLPETHEASSRGAVLLALETIGKIKAIEKVPTPEARCFEPNKVHRAIYRRARAKHNSIYQQIFDQKR
jgi:gluconokinase